MDLKIIVFSTFLVCPIFGSPIEVDLSGVEETKVHECVHDCDGDAKVPLSQRDSGNLLINRKYAMQYIWENNLYDNLSIDLRNVKLV